MREIIDGVMRSFAQVMTLYSDKRPEGTDFFGRISPIGRTQTDKLHVRTRAGGVKRAEFLLLAQDSSFPEGETGVYIVCDGMRYELLRADRLYLGGESCLWEGILRLSGRTVAGDV